jgi:hypothetical protein
MAAELSPSARGEYEITDINREYLSRGALHVEQLGRGFAWLDTGTPQSLLQASSFIATIEERQGLKIACLEEIGMRAGWLPPEAVSARGRAMASEYGAQSPHDSHDAAILPATYGLFDAAANSGWTWRNAIRAKPCFSASFPMVQRYIDALIPTRSCPAVSMYSHTPRG